MHSHKLTHKPHGQQVLGQKRGREGEQDDEAAKRARGEHVPTGASSQQGLSWKNFLDLEYTPAGAAHGLLIDKMKAIAAAVDKERATAGQQAPGGDLQIEQRAAELVSEACELRIRQVIDALASIAYVCMCVCVCVRVCVCVLACMHVRAAHTTSYRCTCFYCLHMHVCVCVHLHACMFELRIRQAIDVLASIAYVCM
jgi:hypothetical protein